MSATDKAAREAHARGKVLLYIPPQGGHPWRWAYAVWPVENVEAVEVAAKEE